MNPSLLQDVQDYVESNISIFHEKRLQTVKNKRLSAVLKRKNPYLFKAKYTQKAEELIQGIMDAFLSSQEETLFGDFLEGVAIFVAQQVHNGYKPALNELTGIDLVFEKADKVYIVEIKSGPNWGNSSQVTKMYLNFRQAIHKLQVNYPNQSIIPVNGCMYGRDASPRKIGSIKQNGQIVEQLTYWRLCGQDFWYFISNSESLYVDIIEPLGYKAKERNEEFMVEYHKLLNKFTQQFLNEYLNDDGAIAWDKLTQYVSESASSGGINAIHAI